MGFRSDFLEQQRSMWEELADMWYCIGGMDSRERYCREKQTYFYDLWVKATAKGERDGCE